MVNFNYFESFFGRRPKSFKKEARKQIEFNTLNYLRDYGRVDWKSVEEIFKETLEQTDLFNSKEGKMWFAIQGIKSKINASTHKLRKDGHPIISGLGKRGYRYADENCEDFIEMWDEALSSREKRKTNLEKEYDTYKKLIQRIIEKLIAKGRLKEAQELKQVLVKYSR